MSTLALTAKVTDRSGNVGTATHSVTITDPPPPQMLVVGASSFRPGFPDSNAGRLASMQELDRLLAEAAGVGKPVLQLWHVYSGSSFPSAWSGTNMRNGPPNGWQGLLNTKMANGQIRTTAGRDTVLGFYATVPRRYPLRVVFRHEPEDEVAAADRDAYKRDLAEFVRLTLDYADANPDAWIDPAICFMGDPPVHWSEFDPSPYLRAGDKARMLWLVDAYPRLRAATATQPARIDPPGFKYDPPFNWARSMGYERLGLGETTLNLNELAASGLTQADVDRWWREQFTPYVRNCPGLELVALYDSTGPASGTDGYYDKPGELAAIADLALGR